MAGKQKKQAVHPALARARASLEQLRADQTDGTHDRRHLEWLRGKFELHHEPMYAWKAFKLARRTELAVPEWVLAYLDGAADNLMGLAPGAKKIAPAIVEALGFVPGGLEATFRRQHYPQDPRNREKTGAYNPFVDHELPSLERAASVCLELQSGVTKEQAYQAAARALNVGTGVVRSAWKKHLAQFESLLPRPVKK